MVPPPVRSVPPWVDTRGPPPGVRVPSPIRPPPRRNTEGPTRPGQVRRVSRDGYDHWVDPEDLRKFRRPVFMRKRADRPGRKWDHLRSSEPFIMGSGYRPPNVDPYEKWRDFMDSTRRYNGCADRPTHLISQDQLEAQYPGLNNPPHNQDPAPRFAKAQDPRLPPQAHDPAEPPCCRPSMSLGSLGLATELLRMDELHTLRSQAVASIVIDSLAIPYILYMMYDEFTGLPLGLRSAVEKASLTLIDVLFIILKAVSTALALQTRELQSRESHGEWHNYSPYLGLLVCAVVAWIFTFVIMLFRLVDRLKGID
ncbi:Lactose permease [Apiospora arundinis]